jgi:hypothetical protein
MSPVTGALEIVRDVVFDTLYAPENLHGGKGCIFCIPVGQYAAGRQVKQYDDTSMLMAGMLPSPCKFLIQSFHCHLFYPDGGLIPMGDHAWEGTFSMEINCRVVKELRLRDMADADVSHIIRRALRDQKWYNVQELENPLMDKSEFESAIAGKLRDRKDLFLIETCEAFIGRVAFAHEIRVPLKAIFALNGICARAIV